MIKEDVQLSIIKNRENELPDVLVEKYISSRFEFSFSGISIKDKDGYIEHLKKELGNIEVSEFDFGFGKGKCYLERKDKNKPINTSIEDCLIFLTVFSSESYIEIYTNTIKESEYIYNLSKAFIEEDKEPRVRMHNYYHEGRLSFKENIVKSKDLGVISEDYYPDFIDTNNFFEQFTKSNENLLVLSGKVGTGKTKFSTLYLNYLMKNIQILDKDNSYDDFEEEDNNFINVAFVKNEEILAMDSFWVNLREFEYDIVILDDLDYFLEPRVGLVNSEKSLLKDKFISHFLSFTDGLIPNKTKFFVTTNRSISDIDEGMRRDGRLFAIFEFSLLTRKEAYQIWKDNDLSLKAFDEEFGKSENILQAKLGSKIHTYLNNNKQKVKPFLKENSLADISNKFISKKRAGF